MKWSVQKDDTVMVNYRLQDRYIVDAVFDKAIRLPVSAAIKTVSRLLGELIMLPRFNVAKPNNCSINRPVLIYTVILLLLGGAVNDTAGWQFHTKPVTEFSQYSEVMADDVSNQIARLYPAASTQFDMQHPASDPFGQALIDSLRTLDMRFRKR
ncbi:MAG: hypothetical protein H6937_09790 [Burkholderiales bacterium]|nr:hypothetical protein [Burkholderiales bacterium]